MFSGKFRCPIQWVIGVSLSIGSFFGTEASAAPLVLFTSPDEGSFVTTANYEEFTVSGFCSENGRLVFIGGAKSATITCSGNVWSATFDVSFLFDGELKFTANHTNASAEVSPTAVRTFVKDTIPPFGNTLVINDGIVPTTLTVELALTSSEATDVYITNTAGCTSGGEWIPFSPTISWILEPIGTTATVYVQFRDLAGNPSGCLSASTEVDLSVPPPPSPALVAITSPTAAPSFSLSGTCSELNRPVSIAGSAAGIAPCVSGTWSATFDLSTVPDGNIPFTVNHANSAGAITTATASYTKDTVLPVLSVNAPASGTYVNLANRAAYRVSGTCSESGRDVALTAVSTPGAPISLGVVACASGLWLKDADLTPLGDGEIIVTASQTDAAGNLGNASGLFAKDTVPPVLLAVLINGGALVTNTKAATVSIEASDAATMKVHPVADCAGSAADQFFSTPLPLTLIPLEGVGTVSARVRDIAGNESACVSDSIGYDITPPTIAFSAPASNSYVNAVSAPSVALSGTCSEISADVVLSGAASAIVPCTSGSWSTVFNLTSLLDGTITFYADHRDAAGNAAPRATLSLRKDTLAPAAGTIVIAGNAPYTVSTSVALTIAAAGASEIYVTNSPTCSLGGAWEPYATARPWILGQTNAVATVYFTSRDLAGNVGPCVSDSIIHDDIAPEAPVFSYAEPLSPSESTTPRIYGSTPSIDTKIALIYTDAGCASTVLASPTPEVFTYTGVVIPVATNQTTTIYGKSTDFAGNTGVCAVVTTYEQRTPPLTISPETYTLSSSIDQALRFVVSGGIAPYRFTIVSGQGTVNETSGAYNVLAGATGETVVRVTDSVGNTADAVLTHRLELALFFDGPILAIGVDADRNRYYGGSFSRIGGSPGGGLIGIDGGGNASPGFAIGSGFNGLVHTTLYLPDGSAIVGGAFTHYRNQPANSIAKLNPHGELDLSFTGTGTNGAVYTLARDPATGAIFVGGSFTRYRGNVANGLVKVNAYGTADIVFTPLAGPNGVDGTVYALSIRSGGLFVGGKFSAYRGAVAPGIARLALKNGALDTTFNPNGSGFGGAVYALVTDGTHLYAGGAFKAYNGVPANGVAKLTLKGLLDPTFNPPNAPNGVAEGLGAVRALALSKTSLYIGGDFRRYRGSLALNIAMVALNGTINPAFSPNLETENGTDGPVHGLAIAKDFVIAVGPFSRYRSFAANGLAKFSAKTGLFDSRFYGRGRGFARKGMVPSLQTVATSADGSRLIVGGDTSGALFGGTPVRNLVKVRPDGIVDLEFLPGDAGPNGSVEAIAIAGREIYVGGAFTSIRAQRAYAIAKLDPQGTLDRGFSPPSGPNGFNKAVSALAVANGTVYAGGAFSAYRGKNMIRIAKLTSAGLADPTFTGYDGMNGDVHSLAIGGTNASVLYSGGRFNLFKKLKAHRVARIFTAGGILDTIFNPQSGAYGDSNGDNNDVLALAVDPATGKVYVGGRFNRYRGAVSNAVIRLLPDGRVDSSFSAQTTGEIRAIALDSTGTRVFIGGNIPTVNETTVNHLVALDPSGALDPQFLPTTGAFGVIPAHPSMTPVEALFVDGDRLLVGGGFVGYREESVSNLLVLDFSGNAH
jgi:hypothetical protein